MRSCSLLTLLLVLLLPVLALAQAPVQYSLSFPNAVHHEASISAVFADLPAGTLAVRMARSSPGRYALHEFAKNVYQVRAFDGAGKELPLTRPNPHQWDVSGHDGTVRFTYTLFGDRADGTYAQIDGTHAHLNMPATLVYAQGLENRKAQVRFELPAGKNWQVATQLPAKAGSPQVFEARDLQYLMDSPVEIADLQFREWQVNLGGKTQTIRVALHSPATAADLEAYARQAQKITAEAAAVFRAYPGFDFGRYTFLACYMPQASGDGMEHRNSTFLTSAAILSGDAGNHLSTLSHEFFHAWNVERLRPRSLEPFNFAQANMSGELWFAEGFTSYYGDLLLCRSQVYSPKDYAASLTGDLDYVLNAPGSRLASPVEMSYQAPFVDAARSVDPVNRHNTYISYYPFGAVVGLALDLSLRSRFKNISLDTYMQEAWKQYGKAEKPYQVDDLEKVLAQVTGDQKFAENFFRRHVKGRELADYKTLLAPAGMLLRRRHAGKASLGPEELAEYQGKVVVTSGASIGSPLYLAGVEGGDALLSLNGQALSSRQEVMRILAAQKPGAKLTLTYLQRGETKNAALTLQEDQQLEVVLFEEAGLKVTKQMLAFRNSWLGARAK